MFACRSEPFAECSRHRRSLRNTDIALQLASASFIRYSGFMFKPDWPQIIRALVEDGLTQPEIARLCECGQSTISDLLRGETTDPRTSTGLLLLGLAKMRGVADPTWPHPAGRPCIDVAAPKDERAAA
jgi:hypothetical protein